MSTIRNPVGPQPPSVYWRRRLVALLALVAVIVVIVLIVSAIANSNNKATPSPTNTNSSKPSDQPNPNPSGTPSFPASGGGDTCAAGQVQITAVTDSNSYKSGVKPMISMKVTNAGTTPCTFDVGTAAQEYIITSGNDRIWSSKDCQKDPANTPQVLEPGVELTTTPFAWDRTRSSTSTCNATRPAAVAGADGPTYKLQVILGDVKSETVSFRLF